VVPEFLQEDCTAENLARALREVMAATPARASQVDAFAGIESIMTTGGVSPSVRAADIVLATVRKGRRAS